MRAPFPSPVTVPAIAAACMLGNLPAQEPPRSPVPVPPAPPSLPAGKGAPAVTDIWVVFKTHCDLGYTQSVEAVNEKYRVAMMENAIKLIEADRAKPESERFKWSIAGWPMARNILGPKQDPARKAKIEQALREGSIAVHALPATIHTEVFDVEDYTRSLGYSSQIARAYGHPLPIACKMTDVPAHGWFLPTLLHHAGVRFIEIAGNYSNRSPLLPRLFWWEGPDGSRVLCNYVASRGEPIYSSGPIPPKDWPARNYLGIVMTHDNEGPPSPHEVEAVRQTVAKQVPGAKLHFATLDDFAKAVLAESPDLPVIRADMPDPWIHGVSSMPIESGIARKVRPLLPALELLDSELRARGLTTAPLAGLLADAYENSMLYAEHTWGANTPGWGFFSPDGVNRGTERYLYGDAFRKARASGYYTKFEASFDDHRAFILKCEATAQAGLKARLDLLAKSVKQEGSRAVVFNPLPWKRSGTVEIAGKTYFAKDVPPGGYLTLSATSDKPALSDLSGTLLETPHFRATFDLERGGISSLVEKATGRQMIDRSSPYALCQFLHERFSNAQTWDYYHRYCLMNNSAWGTVKPNMPADAKYAALTPGKWTLSATREATGAKVVLTAGDTLGLAKGHSIAFSFPNHNASIEVAWSVTDKTPDPIPEGGWLCFPFAAKNSRHTIGRLGGPIDFAKDIIPGANRRLLGVATGAAVTDADGAGAALCSPDAPAMSFGEPGLWKYSYDFVPNNGSVFVHLYNNMWNTNFPNWTEGSWSAHVVLWPLANGADVAESLGVRAAEIRTPLLVGRADGPAGTLSVASSGLTVSRKGVLVTAFGANPDAAMTIADANITPPSPAGTLLRVWEQAGMSGDLAITLPPGFAAATATPVDLRGQRIKNRPPLKISGNRLTISLKAYSPASFVLK